MRAAVLVQLPRPARLARPIAACPALTAPAVLCVAVHAPATAAASGLRCSGCGSLGPWAAAATVGKLRGARRGGPLPTQRGAGAVLERLQQLLAEFRASRSATGKTPRGVYIYGDPGAGKTMMMDMFHQAVCESGLPSRRAHFHDFMLDMNRELHRIRREVGGIQDPLAKVAQNFVKESPLLCFDECHVLNVGDALLMRSFFERLFEAGGIVVATSNLAPDELYSSGINREVFQPFIDAMMAHCDPIRLSVGEDFRTSRSASLAAASGERTFFWPPGPEADRRLRSTLATLLGEASGELPVPTAGDIRVPMGRMLPCRRMWVDSHVRAAEFSYDELCTRPVGTYDYIALAENFDVLVLTGVPRFASTDENAARRFASLVDILYDRHKRLLCTIEAPPHELFAAIREQYSGGAEDIDEPRAQVRMPTFGGSSGKHVAQFRLPHTVHYTEHGGYNVSGADSEQPSLRPQMEEQDGGWVEWSATGLKDASMFDLTCHTKAQQHDRLLPLLRCESRLEEMSYLHGQTSA
eukprot:CAMPEP_0170327362 /NCGR_PEP_ID=MMETSP0116_2-20130129/64570_1 /TAXON_ID=400756 /ORGANISM="Durinskia baltica, Strain CSIRO CS-38" /LENGTH=524 /DNA_ID=CAMNT_0010580443 /DNA_START=25 /DNA_END=1596 /DNA_ORIENTATION=-